MIIIITAFCLANDGHLLFSAQWLQKPLRGSWWEVLTRGWLIYCPPPTHTHTLYPTPNTHTLPLLSQHRLLGLHALLLFLSRPYLLSFLVNSSSVFSPHLTSTYVFGTSTSLFIFQDILQSCIIWNLLDFHGKSRRYKETADRKQNCPDVLKPLEHYCTRLLQLLHSDKFCSL